MLRVVDLVGRDRRRTGGPLWRRQQALRASTAVATLELSSTYVLDTIELLLWQLHVPPAILDSAQPWRGIKATE
eukprot:6281270-Pyramimonas_sp.AAC.1